MTAIDKARRTLTEARNRLAQWQESYAAATRERDTAATAVPDSPADLEGYADSFARTEGRIVAARNGMDAAAVAVVQAHAEIMRAGIEDADAEVKRAERAHAAHMRKVDDLLGKLRDLDGAEYRIVTMDDHERAGEVGVGFTMKHGTGTILAGKASHARALAAVLRSILERGEVPVNGWDAGLDLRDGRNRLVAELVEIPDYAHEYLAARAAATVNA